MADIKPDEISAILRQQLSNFNASADLEEVGTVLQVGDGIARVYGLNGVRSGELVEFENGTKAIALNLEEDNVGVVLMGDSKGIKEGNKVMMMIVSRHTLDKHSYFSYYSIMITMSTIRYLSLRLRNRRPSR